MANDVCLFILFHFFFSEADDKKSKKNAVSEKFAEAQEKMQKKADVSVSSLPGRQSSNKT